MSINKLLNPFMPTGALNICCPRDCVSRHNGGTSGAPLKPLRVDSALRALSSLRGLGGHPRGPHYAERRQSLGQQMLEQWAKIGCENATVGKNGLRQIGYMWPSLFRYRNSGRIEGFSIERASIKNAKIDNYLSENRYFMKISRNSNRFAHS